MAYMYCNHSDCNETVQLPNKYCYKHTPKKAKELTLDVDTSKVVRLDLFEHKPKGKTKKTTK